MERGRRERERKEVVTWWSADDGGPLHPALLAHRGEDGWPVGVGGWWAVGGLVPPLLGAGGRGVRRTKVLHPPPLGLRAPRRVVNLDVVLHQHVLDVIHPEAVQLEGEADGVLPQLWACKGLLGYVWLQINNIMATVWLHYDIYVWILVSSNLTEVS